MTTTTSTRTRFPLGGLLVLSGAIFVSVTSEFLPTGLLPQMARDLGVSESRIGLLVSLFAATVVLATVPLTALTARIPRKPLMLVALGVFAVTNLAAALAPSYELLAASRVLGGMAHGLFWAVAGPYAARMVEPRQLSRALSISNGGGSLAFILGVPAGTALGQLLGWRASFAVMAVVVLVFLLLVVIVLPPVEHLVPLATAELTIPMRRDRSMPGVWIVCGTVLLFAVGHTTLYTYIAPWAIQVGGVDESFIGAALLACGVAGAVGLGVSGVLGDRAPRWALPGMLAMAGVAIILLLPGSAWVGISVLLLAVWNFAFGGVPALAQARMMATASLRVRDLASALYTVAFNASISLGSLVGGLVIDGWGISALPWVASAGFAAAIVFSVTTDRARRAVAAGVGGPLSASPH